MEKKMIYRIAIYCRVSTIDQSCERQEMELKKFAMRVNYKIIGIFKEKTSGIKMKQIERKKVQFLAKKRKIDGILVTELSRWGRSTIDLIHTLYELKTYKVSLIAANGITFDLSSPYGRMLATFISAIAEFERDLISERIKSGISLAKSKGKKIGRKQGFCPTSDKFFSKVIKLISQGKSYRWIAKDLQINKNTVMKIVKKYRANNK